MADYQSAYTGQEIDAGIAKANTALQEHQHLKTINDQSLIGDGNIVIEGGVENKPWRNKIISIMGDSISTFQGWIPTNDGHNLSHVAYYPRGTFNDVTKTWWHSLISDLGAKLGVNESWSGSYVGNTSNNEIVSGGNNYGTKCAMASNTRVQNLGSNGTPDLILVYGGTNDIWSGTSRMGETVPGTFDSTAVQEINVSTLLETNTWTSFADAYRDMLLKMMYYYPQSRIVVLFPFYADSSSAYSHAKLDAFIEVQRNICDYFGINYIDLRACGINIANNSSSKNKEGFTTILTQNVHPNYDGMRLMKDYIKARLLSLFATDGQENVTYTVTNNLTVNTNTDRYIKKVSSGKSYNAIITGSGLNAIKVYMNSVDVTSTVYNSSTGVINISSVTGNIVIAEGQIITYTVSTSISNGSNTGATSIAEGGTAIVNLTANNGYRLPSTITVSGATHNYNSSTGVVTLSNPTGNVTITATCVEIISYSITTNVTNGTYSGANAIIEENTATVTIVPSSGYALPSTVTVSGATYTYNDSTGVINLSNPMENVIITAICVSAITYNIATNITNGTSSGDSTIVDGGTATITLAPNSYYDLPSSITVTGATYTYSSTTGIVNLSNPTGNISITVVCVPITDIWYSSNYNANRVNTGANLKFAGFAYLNGLYDDNGLIMNEVRFTLHTPGLITVGKVSSDFKTIVDSEQINVTGANGDVKEIALSKTYTLENGEHFFINAPSGDTGLFKYANKNVPASAGDIGFMTYVGTDLAKANTTPHENISVDFGYKLSNNV